MRPRRRPRPSRQLAGDALAVIERSLVELDESDDPRAGDHRRLRPAARRASPPAASERRPAETPVEHLHRGLAALPIRPEPAARAHRRSSSKPASARIRWDRDERDAARRAFREARDDLAGAPATRGGDGVRSLPPHASPSSSSSRVIAVVADPVHRGTTMRVALVALVLVGLVALVRPRRPAAARQPARSPFDPAPVPAYRPPVPFEVHRLASDLELYQHAGGARLGSGAADRRRARRSCATACAATTASRSVRTPLADPAALACLGPATRACLARRASNDPAPIDPQALVAELEAL